jgi:hypothetical protein
MQKIFILVVLCKSVDGPPTSTVPTKGGLLTVHFYIRYRIYLQYLETYRNVQASLLYDTLLKFLIKVRCIGYLYNTGTALLVFTTTMHVLSLYCR